MNVIGKNIIFFFAFSSIVTSYVYKKQLTNLIVFSNIFSFLLLAFYYVKSVKKPTILPVLFLLVLFFAEITFNLNYPKIIPYTFSFSHRSILLFLVLKNSRKIDTKTFWSVVLYFSIISIIILILAYSKSVLFLLTVLISIVSILLSSLLFTNLLKTLSKGNIELFLGVFLFLISDTTLEISGFEWEHKNSIHTIIYHISYFLLCQGIIKQQNQLFNKFF